MRTPVASGVLWFLLAAIAAATAAPPQEKESAAKIARRIEAAAQGGRVLALNDALRDLAGTTDPRAAILIPRAGVALPSHANYESAVEAMAGLADGPVIEALAAQLDKRADEREKTAILEAFGRRADPASLEAILREIKSSTPRVASEAARAAARRKSRAAIAPLLQVVEKSWKRRGRAWWEAREALVALTGQDFATIEDWRKFVDGLPEDFDPATVGKEEGITRVERKTSAESVEFFGTEIFSRSVIFVVDVSGSMYMYDEPPEDGAERPGSTSAPGKPSKPRSGNVEEDRRRLTRAREQLVGALKKLPRAALFNIITFSDKVQSWQTRMQPASTSAIQSALKFVDEFQARGATHTDEALELAFADLSVDTIVLLSDGAPVHKDAASSLLIPRILQKVRDWNAARKVMIHTFGFEGAGIWPEKVPWAAGLRLPPPPTPEEVKTFVEFLENLSKQNDGEFRAIR